MNIRNLYIIKIVLSYMNKAKQIVAIILIIKCFNGKITLD